MHSKASWATTLDNSTQNSRLQLLCNQTETATLGMMYSARGGLDWSHMRGGCYLKSGGLHPLGGLYNILPPASISINKSDPRRLWQYANFFILFHSKIINQWVFCLFPQSKVKYTWIRIARLRANASHALRYGSHSFTCKQRHICFYSRSQTITALWPVLTEGWPSWNDLGGRLDWDKFQ